MSKNNFIGPAEQLKSLFDEMASKKEKANALYRSSARSVLFQLEALCRLYRNVHEKKFFDLWYKEFKALEDTLGALDFFDAQHRFFSQSKNLKPWSEKVFLKHYNEELSFLSDVLVGQGWTDGFRINSFLIGLDALPWPSAKQERRLVAQAMAEEIDRTEQKYHSGELNPYEIEHGLHEFRRKVRWISIYAQALGGMVRLRNEKLIAARLKPYCTKDVLKSSYNALPKPPKGVEWLELDASCFYALSWLIQKLGEWKDEGLVLEGYQHLLQAGAREASEDKKKLPQLFASSLSELSARAEIAIDELVLHERILYKLSRDCKRMALVLEEA
jgi:hypothetical protein